MPVDGTPFDHLFADEERFAIGGVEVRVIAVPGHTNDSVAYLTGDALRQAVETRSERQ